jgi:tetratricopeptide (TPR) repeat protein
MQLQDCLNAQTLARIHINLGTVYGSPNLTAMPGKESNREIAEKHYTKALQTLDKLNQRYPDVPDQQILMAETFNMLGGLLRNSKEYSKAHEQFGKAIELAERLHVGHKDVLNYSFHLSRYQHAQGLNFVLQNEFDQARQWYDQAASHIKPLAESHPTPGYALEFGQLVYDEACLESLEAQATSKEATLAQPEKDRKVGQKCRTAIDLLRTAWDVGFKNYPGALETITIRDPDLQVLRDRADFKELVDRFATEAPSKAPSH